MVQCISLRTEELIYAGVESRMDVCSSFRTVASALNQIELQLKYIVRP